ncbi:MAG: ribonuclease HIII [Myxococcales bacterium]|nr:ribonuclease HIII [Myxococcales bacterium]
MAHTYTLKLPGEEAPRLRLFFSDHGFEMGDAPHAFWRAAGPGCNATFYTSGKLLLQGKEADVWRGLLGDETVEARPYYRALKRHPNPPPACWAGSDEAGKGDYFGPLVVAGVAVKRADLEVLHTLGVDDSKALADSRLPEMVQAITALCDTEVFFIGPAKYNELHGRMGNINRMMAWAHGRVLEALIERGGETGPDWLLVDRFAPDAVMLQGLGPRGRATRFDQWPKAEEDPAVAAASVLARAAFLRGLASLSKRFGLNLPPGAGPQVLTAGRRFLEAHGRGMLGEVAKVHFDTTRQIGGA